MISTLCAAGLCGDAHPIHPARRCSDFGVQFGDHRTIGASLPGYSSESAECVQRSSARPQAALKRRWQRSTDKDTKGFRCK